MSEDEKNKEKDSKMKSNPELQGDESSALRKGKLKMRNLVELILMSACAILLLHLVLVAIFGVNRTEKTSSEDVHTITSARGLKFEVPSNWGITNYWDYSQVSLVPKSSDGSSTVSSSSGSDEMFEGIIVTTGYLNGSTDLTSFTDEIYKAVEETSGVTASHTDIKIADNNAKYITMQKDNAFAGMYYMFHDNLAIEIVCSAKTEARLKEYKKEAEDLMSKFEYTYVSSQDFDTATDESSIGVSSNTEISGGVEISSSEDVSNVSSTEKESSEGSETSKEESK